MSLACRGLSGTTTCVIRSPLGFTITHVVSPHTPSVQLTPALKGLSMAFPGRHA